VRAAGLRCRVRHAGVWAHERSAVLIARRLHEPVAVVASLRVPLFSDWHHAPRDAQQCAVTPHFATQAADRRAWRAQSYYLRRDQLPEPLSLDARS
jgi:hypothetical protein